MNSISPNLNIMIKACERASKVIIRDFGEVENLQVSKKGPRDFVTKTDKRVEKILIEELSKAKKNYSFITEESGKIENNEPVVYVFPMGTPPNKLYLFVPLSLLSPNKDPLFSAVLPKRVLVGLDPKRPPPYI